MATLPANDLNDLAAELMAELSLSWEGIPVEAAQFAGFLTDIDAELNTAETSIFQGISNATAKAWLLGNQKLGRLFIERTERKRKETF